LNKLNTATKTISLFLSVMLVAGTITSIFPSSSMKEVHAFSDYGMMDDNYKSKY
jgi:hypothetical protein